MNAPALSAAEIDALRRLAALASQQPDTPERHECSFRAFCLDRLAEADRPNGRVMSLGTFENTARHLRRMGYLDDDGAPVRPPDWNEFRELLRKHPRGPQSLDNQRRALVWWSAYHRVPVPNEPWAKRRLDDRASVEVAKREGRMKERVRFFRIPQDPIALVDPARRAHPDVLNAMTFRCIAWSASYTGPRGSEFWHLRHRDAARVDRGIVNIWAEKQKKRRPVVPPEPWAVSSLLDPTIAHYLKHVRPLLDPNQEYMGPDDPVFLFRPHGADVGRPWPTPSAFRQFLDRGIHTIVKDRSPGAQAWRRFCATIRVRNGWSVEQVALFIGDTPKVIESSYVDWEWLALPGVGIRRSFEERPRVPRLRKNAINGTLRGEDEEQVEKPRRFVEVQDRQDEALV